MSERVTTLREKATHLLAHIAEQIEKEQYLNAADTAAELTRVLLSLFSAKLHDL